MNIDQIIKGCAEGDRLAQNELYKQYYPLMHNIASRYSPGYDQISHLINAGFYKILKNIDSYNSSYSIATFIRNVMVNNCIDEYRKEARHDATLLVGDETDYPQYIEINTGEQQLEEQDVLGLLNFLSPIQRNVFNLFAIDGYSHQEIGQMLDISAGVSRWHLNQARTNLKQLITQRIQLENKPKSQPITL